MNNQTLVHHQENRYPTYCSLLWSNVTIDTNRELRYCCWSDVVGKNTESQTIEEFWNDDHINDARNKMLNGERPNACWKCWADEDIGLESRRLKHNNDRVADGDYPVEKIDENIKASIDNKPMPHGPQSVDIKFGNVCNLQCRMCNPHGSNLINKEAKENKQLYEDGQYFHKEINEANFKWYESDRLYQDLRENIDNIYRIKILGGEPFFNMTVRKFLTELISEDKAKNIKLHVITNATKINKSLIEDIFLKFFFLELNVSVDGIGSHYDYIRFPGKWETVDKNLRLLSEYQSKDMVFYIIITQQFHNLYNIIDIIKYAEKYNLVVPLITEVEYPSHYASRNLSKEIKDKVVNYYRSIEFNHPHHRYLLKRLCDMLSETEVYDPDAIDKFVKYTNTLDKIRGQSFKESCPQEWELLKEYFI